MLFKKFIAASICTCVFTLGHAGEIVRLTHPSCTLHRELCEDETPTQPHVHFEITSLTTSTSS